ncbi:LysM peptidoglycan-binding domain-containing protein [Bradyrhizobium sp. AUGA SZCCT0176]|uniref:LysM peptidoglycan-binding domain-containing protein n=2 Tax=unclassified Bradyrhizobium TaxID=2631580 RepID=UPI001BA4F9D1|nr:Ig-like domain-containing protein [Bradyrhizobium sp. AUGA SZCCT0176]MBR1228695.1 LysM peptidoglycan-binding domain-containing protein [Bradyrhizobium sp. AUGA SZCCT0176]MBR1299622.1 LysM peptidoglycan-binding domain-containing protein [Bradyrhizobium sp. AUGA SZCCT0042]
MSIMIATSMSRIVVPSMVAACSVAAIFAVYYVRQEPRVDTKAVTAAPAVSKPALGAPKQGALAAAQAEANAVTATLGGPPPLPDSVPSFDIARIEPTGEAVIAGRATPGAAVELLRNGEIHDRVVADQSGQFVMVPPRLPSGTYDLTLRAKEPDGKQTSSKQSVTVALEPKSTDRPVVALMAPDKPTVVLSQPAVPKPMAGAVVAETVEIEPGGKLHVSGRARPGAAVKLYLNDSFIASATAGADGRFAVTINEGVASGSYRVRLDEVEQNSGAVRARAEVPFNVPDTMVTASVPAQATAAKRLDVAAAQPPELAAAMAAVLPDNKGSPSTVVVPKITTTTVSRGDSLWRISQLSYGAGTRYAVIYKANREQIRNPNLIYPGQVFVVPVQEARP